MKAELKKINSELLRKRIIATAKHHIINTCPLKLQECKYDMVTCKTVKDEVDLCSECWVNWLLEESEV